AAPVAIAFSPDGRYLYAAGQGTTGLIVYGTNANGVPNSIAQTVPSSQFAGGAPLSVSVSGDGKVVYAVSGTTTYVLTRDPVTGLLTVSGSITGTSGGGQAILASPDNQSVYVVNKTGQGTGTLSAYNRDPVSGALNSQLQLTDSATASVALSGLQSLVYDGV